MRKRTFNTRKVTKKLRKKSREYTVSFDSPEGGRSSMKFNYLNKAREFALKYIGAYVLIENKNGIVLPL